MIERKDLLLGRDRRSDFRMRVAIKRNSSSDQRLRRALYGEGFPSRELLNRLIDRVRRL